MTSACLRNHLKPLLLWTAALVLFAGFVLLPVSGRADEAPASYVLEASALEAFAAESKADGDESGDGFFTLLWSTKSKVDGSSKTWEDGYASGQRVNFGGKATVKKNSLRFTTDGPALVKIWWVQGGEDHRQMGILNADGEVVVQTSGEYQKNSPYYSELTLDAAGTWYLGGIGGNNYLFKVEVVPTPASSVHTLEASALEAFAAETKADGDETGDGFFTLLWSAKSKVDGSSKTWEDGYASGQRVNFGGKATVKKNSLRFTTDGPATVKIWWVQGGEDHRQMGILNADGEVVVQTSGEYQKNSPYYSELILDAAGTWYLGGIGGNNYLFKVEVAQSAAEKPARPAWDSVSAPAILSVGLAEGDPKTVEVLAQADVGENGADWVSVSMAGEGTKAAETKRSTAEKAEHLLSFAPGASGKYTFTPVSGREGEAELPGESVEFAFTLPLERPAVSLAYNLGGGAVRLEWAPVPEAEAYLVSAAGRDLSLETEACEATLEGLPIEESCSFTVAALRKGEEALSEPVILTVTEAAERAWGFSAFGSGVNLKTNGYEGSAEEGSLRVYSLEGKGKLVPGSTDGLAFYYTRIDPRTENFVLTATAHVNAWTYSNGQEGFGLMAADAVGVSGDNATFWNNSYMAAVTKVEYCWDGEKISDTGDKITMKLGVGAQEKRGVTKENITEARTLADMSLFSSEMTSLDASCAPLGPGTYNIVGNAANAPDGTVAEPLTAFALRLEKNNTGYFVSYIAPDGAVTTQKYYDPEALSHLEEKAVYVGFFAARNADITFTDISFATSDPAADAPAEERAVEAIAPQYSVVSAPVANREDYTLEFFSNADGVLTVADGNGAELFSGSVKADEKQYIPLTLTPGDNAFALRMTPDEDFRPGEFAVLQSYEPAELFFQVAFRVNPAEEVTVADPAALYRAVNEAVPGQRILLTAGTYKMDGRLLIERGISGRADAPITLAAAPGLAARPVLDFGGKSAGVVLAGNWWVLSGFDVTNTKDGEKGIQVSGSHNRLEGLETYRNGNTGIQISRYKGTDTTAEWPAENLILQCTSYLNADRGYEDADGFAAKLTCGPGNVFDQCISCYNADDGWDLYAKIETGPIGQVIIRNSVAYKNGFLLDENGGEINAGNGNGFKMGGESISGHHLLENSVAFANKAKGIDSNSCPDIQVLRCTSFDNGSYNVAFYTNTAVNTDFAADGVLSFRSTEGAEDNFKLLGSQDQAKVFHPGCFYVTGGKSVNSEGLEAQVAWFVSLDTQAALAGGIGRNPDGSVSLRDFLRLTDVAPSNVGARLE